MIVGHQKQWQFLKKADELEKIPHAYLFSGEEAIGKKTLAFEFIKLINCETPHHFASRQSGGGARPCQVCRSCQDIEKRIHPDLAIIEPKGKEIQIAQIRELHSHLTLCSYSARFKSVIIDQTHCLNKEAQSSFLKLLEEPKGRTLFILISELPEMLLPTILSRVEVVRFFPVPAADLKDYLKSEGIPEKQAEEFILLSSGKPGRLINFLLDPQKSNYQKKVIQELLEISRSDIALRFQYAKELSGETQNLKEVLDIWLRCFREILISRIRNQELGIRNQSEGYPVFKLKKIVQLIQSTNFLISTTNVNPKLALEILMLEL